MAMTTRAPRLRAQPWRVGLAALALCLVAGPSWAQDAAGPQAQPALEPPVAVTPQAPIALPAEATALTEPVVVRVKIIVGADGKVRRVERLDPPRPPWDDAVIAAATQWTFRPGRYGGKPVTVGITLTHTFLPPPPPAPRPADGGPPLSASLRGRLIEKGTRAPAQGMTVAAEVDGRRYRVQADDRGRFELPLPAGDARITLHGSGYLPYLQRETLAAGQQLAVAYHVERERYDPYEIVVFDTKRREELSRVTLRGREIHQVPGTFGDPFRVVGTLPGVSSIMSLLPLPVVRGASPGSTGFLIDGTRVPMLFHLLAGPSVIHPDFIEEIRFYPGGAPVLYGGYTAGIIDGRTRRARPDESLLDFDINALQAGGLVRQPIPALGATLTLAGRVGYPGVILSLATNQASLSYWDYQARLDGGDANNGYTAFVFGAWDEVEGPAPGTPPNDPNPTLVPVLQLGFHRVDLRGHLSRGRAVHTARVVAGLDTTLTGGTELRKWVLEPTLRSTVQATPRLELVGGLEGIVHDTEVIEGPTTNLGGGGGGGGGGSATSSGLQDLTAGIRRISVATALTEALWRPTPRWLVRPGVRVDWRSDGTTDVLAADPRISARYRLGVLHLPGFDAARLPDEATGAAAVAARDAAADDDRASWLKAGIGLFHQPPRLFLPLPGLDMLPLRYGLLAAVQTSLGAELGVGQGVSLGVEGYFNWMDPVVFDLEVNPSSVITQAQTQLLNPSAEAATPTAQQAFDRLFAGQRGRATGLELLLRKQSRNGPYGWISYTLSLSEREKAAGWAPYDFDRTHLLNVVAGLQLPRNWDVGLRLAYQSGKPATTTAGYNTARGAGYARVDLRIDKRAVWKRWLLDFYVDLTNVALMPEEITPGATLRYVLPTIGLRARL